MLNIILSNFAAYVCVTFAVLSLTRPLGNPWWRIWR
jgi:hypothetical protein